MNIVLAGGGTAGHIEPALNLADELMRRNPESNIVALGTSRGLEVSLVPARGYDLALIPPVPLPRKINFDLFTLPVRFSQAVRDVRRVLEVNKADVVVGFGGYVSIPAYLAARGRVPFIVHEANARPGLANRVGAKFADAVAETVKGSLPGAVLTGLPLRASIQNLNRQEARSKAREFFGISIEAKVLLVFGGSQGAQRINSAVAEFLGSAELENVVVIHALGAKNDFPASPSNTYRPYSYIDRMDLAYAAADFVICRSGAMTVAEISAVGLPACFVPFPIGNGEQSLNAEPVVAAGGAFVVKDEDFTAAFIVEEILPILHDSTALADMALNSKSVGHLDAAQRLADLVEDVLARITK